MAGGEVRRRRACDARREQRLPSTSGMRVRVACSSTPRASRLSSRAMLLAPSSATIAFLFCFLATRDAAPGESPAAAALTLTSCITSAGEEGRPAPASSWTSPRFLEVFASKELTPGESLSLKCTATGVPLPQITWTVDGFGLESLPSLRSGDYVTNDNYVVSFVNVSSVKPEHGGSYACKASSEAGDVENGAVVRVLGDPVVRLMTNWTATAGTDVAIKCPVGGWPVDDIFWEKGTHPPSSSFLLLFLSPAAVAAVCQSGNPLPLSSDCDASSGSRLLRAFP